ncbi:MAG TPA: uroporphyrinogen decarboxylase family protein [Armatimonadota bacterium]|jgi:uroporphyrinogen decarboxylase
MTTGENWRRAATFDYPEWIPCGAGFSPITWRTYREELDRVHLDHPRLFPGFVPGANGYYDEMPAVHRQGERFRDNWGCVWYNAHEGLEGQVVESPLADWDRLADYRAPDPLTQFERGEEPRDWEQTARDVEQARAAGGLVGGSGERLFDRLYFLRGFENLMMDFATDDPHLPALLDILEQYETVLIDKWLSLGVEVMGFHTDIGTQRGLMISPAKFRQYLKPLFTRLFQRCHAGGALVALSSDGCLLEIVDDLVDCGVTTHDPQLRANTLPGIVQAYKGKLCANVDLDRQGFPFMTPEEIREQVREVVGEMAAPEGGLMVSGSVWGEDVPLSNIVALVEALEEFCF